jgi:hypothetical protein
MPLTFKSALVDAGIDPKTVRLLRHKDSIAGPVIAAERSIARLVGGRPVRPVGG